MSRRRLREAVARRAGAEPGGEWVETGCAYCSRGLVVMWDERDGPEFVMRGADGHPTGPSAHLDHIIPECLNGPTSLDNTVLACPDCNLVKGGRVFGDPTFQLWLRERRAPLDYQEAVALHERLAELEEVPF